jgi:DNA (cytosine-5)-methyltransferase 1
MTNKTTASLFTGGGLFDIGAIAAGYTPLWGIEWDDKIASVARMNGLNVITGDVRNIDITELQRPDHLHASPPCPNFSVAKTGGEETELDIELAEAVCEFIVSFSPETFTLENVPAYRHSKSFKRITDQLTLSGYWWDVTNLNAADFGVPQTRLRLWVRAKKGMMLYPYPEPVKWKGWYQAIEDLIPELPTAKFAPWQEARLPKEYKEFLIGQGTYSAPLNKDDPAQTITSNVNQTSIKAFIMSSGNNSFVDAIEGGGVRYDDDPVMTMMAGKTESKIKAFILDGGNVRDDGGINIYDSDKPSHTITASTDKTPIRGFVGQGRIVKMTIKALGRFQTVPDTYKGLTVRINGNGVPCLLAQRILETI